MVNESEIARQILDVLPAAIRMIRKELREAARSEFTIPQLRILAHLYRGAETASELAELQGCRPPVITKMVDGLVARDLVKRRQNLKNRRQITLSLTKKGLDSYRRARAAAQAKIRTKIEKLPADRQELLQSGLTVLGEMLLID